MLRRILILLLFILPAVKMKATHIVGGEIYYDYLGNNNYRITLKVYRDCLNGVAPYDNPASVGIFDQNNNLLDTLSMNFPGSNPVPPSINSPCYTPPNNVCVEVAVYTEVKHIVPVNGSTLTIAYQRCCRNGTIVNLSNPGNVGSTYTCEIPDPLSAVHNNSARYNNFPPIYLCQGAPLVFDHSATDPDGDSLSYELCNAYDGADAATPMPQPPNNPPYVSVPYNSPYSGAYPMASNPALSIDPYTGLLTGTPTVVGQWVIAVCCNEYRNGILINVDKRDFQFNVMACPLLTVSSIPNQTVFCAGYNVQFLNNSWNASTYHWDFGVLSTNSDTSNLFMPNYTYPDTGHYNVTLICNPGTPCADTNTTQFQIYPPVAPTFVPPAGECVDGNSFNFAAGGQFMGNGTLTWNFGSNANPDSSNITDPQNVSWNTYGVFPVTLTVSENGCTGTYTDSVTVYPMPTASFAGAHLEGCVPYTVHFSDSSIAGTQLTYAWSFGNGDSSYVASPTYTYTLTGTYDVTLVVATTNGCIGIDTLTVPGMITVDTVPVAGITATPPSTSIFNPFITVTDHSTNADSCHLDFGDGYSTSACDGIHTYWAYGTYDIVQTVYNGYGCWSSDTAQIEILPEDRFYIPNAFTPNGNGLNDIFMPAILGADNYHFMIFDRWGNMLFETHDVNVGWDGRYKGNKCQEDVYVWRITYTDVVDETDRALIGHVNLIR